MRNNEWLEHAMDNLWRRYFADVPRVNPISIKFGRKAKRSLGSIRYDKLSSVSTITINKLLALVEVPSYVVEAVIAHELVHYTHGFNSGHEKRQEYPHLGGVITKELGARGLAEIAKMQKKWVKDNWRAFIKSYY